MLVTKKQAGQPLRSFLPMTIPPPRFSPPRATKVPNPCGSEALDRFYIPRSAPVQKEVLRCCRVARDRDALVDGRDLM